MDKKYFDELYSQTHNAFARSNAGTLDEHHNEINVRGIMFEIFKKIYLAGRAEQARVDRVAVDSVDKNGCSDDSIFEYHNKLIAALDAVKPEAK